MYEILPYSPELDKRLDHFVECESVNGTFLQTRRFLNYHPADRFTDASFALEKSGTIVAYFPGVAKEQTFVSHAGTTFGGPIIAKSFYSGSRLLEILKEADQYLASRFKNIRFKITPAIFAEESPDLLEYMLEHMGYTRHTELSSYCTLQSGVDPLENCDKECRRIFKKSEIEAIRFGNLEKTEDFETFYHFLEISKSKHNVHPVHTLQELYDLKDNRIPDHIRFRGIWDGNTLVAAMMLFLFEGTKTIHGQYIAPNPDYEKFQPTTALYVRVMREAAQEGYKQISWGISTENGGNYLNESLLRFKESLGAKACVNVRYEK
ncbi:MAG: GNAT family N-acetyltransferase [Fibrobacter sp.]|uniref:GNAT family N-acetyltransferase n=1 Tax=Fibrobacter sp. TaxID=35828 RepID=UPI002A911C27|nr:GNAT family N-acetyltransferase [Fibrobacter sp.]MDY6263501.1 GNAT family N-acetyltransferase [Fibrobacter sp.]MDY6387748.1 GNAT family N-acetyltransferase [Fibrobacter sp.]